MGAYINKDLKELIITLASVIGFGDVLVKTGRLHQEDEDAAKLMMGAATTISQHLLHGRDAEQVTALQRQAGFYEIIAVPKTSARIDKEFYICPREDFESLVIDDFSNPSEGKANVRRIVRYSSNNGYVHRGYHVKSQRRRITV